ncbi:MAG TPA: peptide chain release factor 2 [Acidimicrobiales bacterium]|nr:peptide chain release factor 2 [Acidimicrobiales bacterium]
MADPRAENALRDAQSTLDELEGRWTAARDYLKIDASRERHAELSILVEAPNLWDDQDHARDVTTELGRLGNDLELFDGLGRDLEDCRVLAEFSREAIATGEPDWSLLDELSASVERLEQALNALEVQSLFSGPYDENDAIAELHAGAGGTDAQDWAEMMLRMYSRWAERRGFGVEIDEVTEGQEAGILSATFVVKGRFAYGWLSAERGVHRLVRISPFDSQARRQTSFASIDITPMLADDASEVDIDEKELRVDTYRSSGAGGQHVNKTDSAIRITHLPSGIVVSCQNERSQHQNRARAMQILEAKLAERARAQRQAQMDALSGDRGDNAWGSQIRSYVQAPYQLVKDHRTEYETGNVEAVLDGDLDGFMEAELRRQRSRS